MAWQEQEHTTKVLTLKLGETSLTVIGSPGNCPHKPNCMQWRVQGSMIRAMPSTLEAETEEEAKFAALSYLRAEANRIIQAINLEINK